MQAERLGVAPDRRPGELVVAFVTPSAPPLPVLDALAERFPAVEMTLTAWDEQKAYCVLGRKPAGTARLAVARLTAPADEPAFDRFDYDAAVARVRRVLAGGGGDDLAGLNVVWRDAPAGLAAGGGADDVLLGRLGAEERDALVAHWLGVWTHNQVLFALADAEPAHECAGPDEVRRLSQAEWRLAALGYDPASGRGRALLTAAEERWRAVCGEAGGLYREFLTDGSAAAA